jgi:hypothetical protein
MECTAGHRTSSKVLALLTQIVAILKSQNFDMVASDGAKQGTCDEISGQAYSCPSNGGKIHQGNRKFHCKVYATAAQIKAAK